MTYGYLCEDSALEFFIDEVLKQFGPKSKCKEFIRHNDFCDTYKPPSGRNSSQIRKLYADAAKRAIGTYKLDLFIVGYDYDDGDINQYESVIHNHIEEIDNKARKKSVFSIPVRCIEYWLWYIKNSATSTPNSLENNHNFTRHQAKSEVYERPLEEGKYRDQSVTTQLAKAKTVLQNLDINRLQELSPSFRKFVEQIKAFCNTYSQK